MKMRLQTKRPCSRNGSRLVLIRLKIYDLYLLLMAKWLVTLKYGQRESHLSIRGSGRAWTRSMKVWVLERIFLPGVKNARKRPWLKSRLICASPHRLEHTGRQIKPNDYLKIWVISAF